MTGEKATTVARHRFRSQILPPYMRRSPKVAEVLPILYLRGLSTGDFKEGLAALLGDDASGLSPTAITRLTAAWQADYEAFQKRDLSDRDYVYVWADGVHFRIRLEEDRLCALVMIGVRPDGTKELIAIEDGYRESAESWATLLRGLKRPRDARSGPGRGRRGARLLEGAARRVARDARAAVLGAPDRQRARQAPEATSCEGQGGASRDHAGRDAQGGTASDRPFAQAAGAGRRARGDGSERRAAYSEATPRRRASERRSRLLPEPCYRLERVAPNVALKIIDRAIQRDMESQREAIKNKQFSAQMGLQLAQEMRAAFRDDMVASEAMQATLLRYTENRLQAIISQTNDQVLRARGEEAIANLRMQYAEKIEAAGLPPSPSWTMRRNCSTWLPRRTISSVMSRRSAASTIS